MMESMTRGSCGCDDHPEAEAIAELVASRFKLLKAVAPEEAEIVRREIELREELFAIHKAAALASIDAAIDTIEKLDDINNDASAEEVSEAASKAYRQEFEEKAVETVQEFTEIAYRIGKSFAVRRITGESPKTDKRPRAPEAPKIIKAAPLDVQFLIDFSLVDEEALDALKGNQVFWVGDHYNTKISNRIATVARTTMIERGLGQANAVTIDELRQGLAAEFALAPKAPFPIPGGFTGRASEYFQSLAANTMTVGRVHGSVRQFDEIGVQRLQISAVNDRRTCTRCSFMDGQIVETGDAVGQMNAVQGASNPDEVRAAQPWLPRSAFQGFRASGIGSAGLRAAGQTLPPFHFRCRCTVDIADDAEFFDDLGEG